MNGQLYMPPAAVVLVVEDDYPVFGLIKHIYMVHTVRPVANVNVMLTRKFSTHYIPWLCC